MKKPSILIIFALLTTLITGCTSDKTPHEKVVAKINNYNLSIEEFNEKLSDELEYDNSSKLTSQTKIDFLNELIKKELLIQEAKNLGLDSRQKFISTIERYWESTLIRDLMEMKGAEIIEQTNISKEEINSYIETLHSETERLAAKMPERKNEVLSQLREAKKRTHLKKWINDLRNNANVTINKNLLNEK